MLSLPSISIAVPTFNESDCIIACLASIFRQGYPASLLQVIVVDDRSTDDTVARARLFPVEVLYSGLHDPERSKMLGLQAATGDLFMYMDADAEMVSSDWLRQMALAFDEQPALAGAFTRYLPRAADPPLNRYLSQDPLQMDPVYHWFTTKIEETVVEKRASYWLCRYIPGAIPPSGGMTLYRRALLADALTGAYRFLDVDVPVILAEAGHQDFAYVPGAGFYHMHARSLRELVHKRLRSLQGTYLPDASTRVFRWFDLTTPQGIARIGVWVVLVHLFLPLAIRSAIRAIRHRDAVYLYEPFLAIVLTDVILWGFLCSPRGRRVIAGGLRRLLERS